MSTPSTHTPYLLLADDDAEDRSWFLEAFIQLNPGCIVEQTSSGLAVLEFLKAAGELPLVLMLDFQMPDLNGPEILQHLAANSRYRKMTKVIWSSSRRIKDMEDCQRLGASHYIVKPSDTMELQFIVKKVGAIFYLASMEREEKYSRLL
jgi:CheY-like chemotaxis protein